jgi:hypothetical protein
LSLLKTAVLNFRQLSAASRPEAAGELVGWRSCPPAAAGVPRDLAGRLCCRRAVGPHPWPSCPSPRAQAGAPAASPMTCPTIRDPLRTAVGTAHPERGSVVDWKAAKRDRGPRELAGSGQERPRRGRYAAPRLARQSRAQQQSLRRSRDASWLLSSVTVPDKRPSDPTPVTGAGLLRRKRRSGSAQGMYRERPVCLAAIYRGAEYIMVAAPGMIRSV